MSGGTKITDQRGSNRASRNKKTDAYLGDKKVSPESTKGSTTQRVKEGVQSLISTVRSLFSRNVKQDTKQQATGTVRKSHPMPNYAPPKPPIEEGNAVAARVLKNPPPLPPIPTAIPTKPNGPAPTVPKKAALKSKVAKNVAPEQRAQTDAINEELATRKSKNQAGSDAPPAKPAKPKNVEKDLKKQVEKNK